MFDCFKKSSETVRAIYTNDAPRNHKYPNNKITNTKYTWWNFIPKNLFEQFRSFMNIYFLIIGLLQLSSTLTPVNPASTWGGLIFIFSVSAIKAGFDDYNRAVRDRKANNRPVIVLRGGRREHIRSMDILVGDIVFVQNNEEIPCDLLLLTTSDPEGMCYVQTANLDGETDYKPRQAPRETTHMTEVDLGRFKAVVECMPPNKDVYVFDSRISLRPSSADNSSEFNWTSLSSKNTVLQATHLRNTEWVYGLSVYTGNETKIGKNKATTPYKATKLDQAINKVSIFIFSLQFSLVFIFGFIGERTRRTTMASVWYLDYFDFYSPISWAIIPLRFLLLNSLMIPISLKVTIDVIKYTYSLFIDWDRKMYCAETDTPATANNTAVAEDLGQVQYVFSDKTGTLTENLMVFKKCSIDGRVFPSEGDSNIDNTPLTVQTLKGSIIGADEKVIEFFRALALCHTVVPSTSNEGNIVYKASSPDEEALVKAAASLDIVFTHRDLRTLEIRVKGEPEVYSILYVLEFSSDRKRMSILLRDQKTKNVILYCKGADDVILPRLAENQTLNDLESGTNNDNVALSTRHIEDFAKTGLRTLCVTYRVVPEAEYESWVARLKVANTNMADRGKKVEDVYNSIEQGLTLAGISAIEDKLQESVPETIEILRNAGIRVWMLTGDRYSTAVQIATSCNLLGENGKDSLITVSVDDSIESLVQRAQELSSQGKVVYVIIEGWVLERVFQSASSKESFSRLSLLAGSVICCRVTPLQKAEVVKMVKDRGFVTLAIGDGGNDVSMIQSANIGVGISGREGLQAARAADFSIGRFKFLQRLLLIHGRYSYHRTCLVALYCFYKSLYICFMQVMFQLLCGFAGTTFFSSFNLTTYNIIWTGLPIIGYVLDKDLPEDVILRFPYIYRDSQRGRSFNPTVFSLWFFRAIYQSFAVFILSLFVIWTRERGSTIAYAGIDIGPFTASVILQQLTLLLEHNSVTIYNQVLIWGTIILYFAALPITSIFPAWDSYNVVFVLYLDPFWWLSVFLVCVVALLPVIAIKHYFLIWYPTASQVFRQLNLLSIPFILPWKKESSIFLRPNFPFRLFDNPENKYVIDMITLSPSNTSLRTSGSLPLPHSRVPNSEYDNEDDSAPLLIR